MATKSKSARSKSAAKSKSAAAKSKRNVYYFGDGKADGAGSMKPLLGGKGANLAEMTRIGSAGPAGIHDHDRGLHLLFRE